MPLGKRGDVALRESGVTWRTLSNDDGTLEYWQQPELPPWEVAKRNPHERRPWAPGWEPDEVAAQQQWRERQRVRDAAQHAAAARYEGPQTPESTALAAARETAS